MAKADAPCVLVVDDDASLIRMMRLSFVSEGFQVFAASDGLQALERLATQIVDVIVLDLLMPRMDGRAFYREMRARGYNPPVILVSAYGAATARDELGADAALDKPFDPDVLIREVRRLLELRARNRSAGGFNRFTFPTSLAGQLGGAE
jgi:CheY-like chemotaxis protein